MAVNSLSVNQDQFLQMLLTQLKNQDPVNPVSSSDMLGQLTQLSTLQSLQQLNAGFADLLQMQQLSQGGSLLGRSIRYADPTTSSSATGVVSGVEVKDGAILLNVGGRTVPLSQVTNVMAA
ncbi:MAG: flagellar hook capping protein [Gemmataceae bacterium]|nr:flagellar hook capping protein [Gemmataceae bacterium]